MTRPSSRRAPVVVPGPTRRGDLTLYRPAAPVTRRSAHLEHQRALHARWLVRQAQAAERDRRLRRIVLWAALAFVVAFLATAALLAYQVYRAVTDHGDVIVGGTFMVVVAAVLVSGSAGTCVIVIRITHRR